MSELLPYPFCGGPGKLARASHNELRQVHCVDQKCTALGVEVTPEKAIEAWNRRTEAPEPAVDEVLVERITNTLHRLGCPIDSSNCHFAVNEIMKVIVHPTEPKVDVGLVERVTDELAHFLRCLRDYSRKECENEARRVLALARAFVPELKGE